MANELVVPKTQLPAHLMDLFKPENNDDLGGLGGGGFGALSIKGKEFAVSQGKDKQTVLSLVDGEEVPARHLDVVILKAVKGSSKTYYEGEYVEGADVQPRCQSTGGVKPDLSVEKPVHHLCATCPMNKFGTGKNGSGKACGDNKRVAVALLEDLDRPLLLRMAYTSAKPLEEYARTLAKRSVGYPAVVTRLGFEQGVTHPQLTYKPTRFITDAEKDVVVSHIGSSIVEDIIGLNVPVHEGVPPNGSAAGKAIQEVAKAPEAPKAQTASVPAKAAAAKPAPKPEPKPEVNDFLIDEPAPVKSKPAKAPEPKIVEATVEAKPGDDAAIVQALAEFDL